MKVLTCFICYTSSSLNVFLTPWKKFPFPKWSLSVTGFWVCLLIDHLCAYRFANSHHTVLHIIGSLF